MIILFFQYYLCDCDFSYWKTGATSELIECFGSEPQLTTGKSEIKRVIEKLVMQETFSR